MSIHGETAFVTGGGIGIGRTICVELASHGLEVIVADIDSDARHETVAEIEKAGGSAIETYLDLADPESIVDAVSVAEDTAGTVDILVNNAGIAGPTTTIEETSLEEWDETLSVNLRGAFLCTRELIGAMKSQEYGRVINISSSSGKRAVPMRSPYTSSKAGLLGLTRTTAAEGGPYGVTANAICPGSVEGSRIEAVINAEASTSEKSRTDIVEEKQQKTLCNSFVKPEDVAGLVSYLCSDEAARITGQALNVSGGKIVY